MIIGGRVRLGVGEVNLIEKAGKAMEKFVWFKTEIPVMYWHTHTYVCG